MAFVMLKTDLLQAQDYNRTGNHESAKQCGFMALGYNIAVVVFYVVEVIIAITIGALFVSGGLALLSTVATGSTGSPSVTGNTGSCTTQYTCGYYGGSYTCTYRCT